MELMIPLNTRLDAPLYEQIYGYIKKEIRSGSLKASTRLPSTRVLAEHLKVSRSTTQMAYEQLVSEGYIETVPCKGYFVTRIEELVEVKQESCGEFEENFEDGFADCFGNKFGAEFGAEFGVESEAELEAQRPERYVVDFSPRGIDLSHFPYNVWRKVTKNTLVDDNKELFLTGNPQGEPGLREAIRGYLHSARGVNCTREQIIVGAGSEYLLMLLSRILGTDRVIGMESPTYRQAYLVLNSQGFHVVPVEMDRYGLSAELLEKSGADIAYVMPSHQYPMGIVMPVRRRQELLNWAGRDAARYLIEDDYDSEFRYKGKPIPALQGMDTAGKVIYIGTFSKSIAPAIRVSYMVLPMPLLELYQKTAGFYASTVSRIDQNILYQFLVDGYYERHLNRMRAIYKAKHDTLMAALKELETEFSVKGEYAGLHVLLTHRKGRPENWLLAQAGKAGVKVYGLSSYFIHPQHNMYTSTVVLGYAKLDAEEIERGIALLKQAWTD